MEVDAEKNQSGNPNYIGRDDRGRFAPGNPGGPGGNVKDRSRARNVLEKLLAENDYQKIRELALALYDQAIEGDTAAAKILLEYALGKPDQAIELSGSLGFNLADLKRAYHEAKAEEKENQG